MTTDRTIQGLLLAGGRARRMGGQDKGLLTVAEQPLVHWTLKRLQAQVPIVHINANRQLARYRQFGCPVIADKIGGFAGPLAGIHAGMTAATSEWLVTVPCDSPFFPDDLTARLSAASDTADIAVAVADGRPQPVFMLVKTALAEDLADFLTKGDGKIARWYGRHKHAEVPFADGRAFDNINTPAELLAAAERLAPDHAVAAPSPR